MRYAAEAVQLFRQLAFTPLKRGVYEKGAKSREKIFEPVDVAGGNEQERTGVNGMPPLSIEESSLPACHEINLVARVRRLCIPAYWCI